jgi:hypothetical protein
MIRIIAIAILAAGILAACDDGPTGPTAQSGEVALELFKHSENTDKDTGEGYNFTSGEKIGVTPYTSVEDIDICAFPTRIESYDISIRASRQRIYIGGQQTGVIYFNYDESKEFELVTVGSEARYKIFAQNHKIGFDEERNGMVSEFVIRYKLLST